MKIYKHPSHTGSVSNAARFIITSGDKQATILILRTGSIVTNDLDPEWLDEVVQRRDELGYVQSNLLEILILTGITKQEVEELLG